MNRRSHPDAEEILRRFAKLIPREILEKYDDDSHVSIQWTTAKKGRHLASSTTVGLFHEAVEWVARKDASE